MDCPGCGIQRSISFLLQGEIWASIKMYPGLLPVGFLFIFLAADFIFKIKNAEKIKIYLTVFTLGVILINYILKFIL